ncbi:MAG: hypothetical protein A2Y17_07785 [Clostridiales bacterium GWF2_38_85]|nr:MAG: hypothetical protein A2Y17_07785 [Clostridiales bacterium GWF2_38_85]HBL84224.1 FAD-dependent oxidoreductase [Clostridiales bacterium]
MSKTYIEPQKELSVSYTADVIVVGGGTAGAVAAIAAAEEGKSVIIVEQFGSLGGSSTNGLVCPNMGVGIPGNPACSSIARRIFAKLMEYGATKSNGTPNPAAFDPRIMSIVLEEMCEEAGVKILYHTYFCDAVKDKKGNLAGVIVENKTGRTVVEGKIFIDCSGDADLCVRAGAEYTKGNPETGKNQPISLRYIIAGIDCNEFSKYLQEQIDRTGVNCGIVPKDCYAAVTGLIEYTMTTVFKEAIAAGDLIENDMLYWQMFSLPGRADSLAFNNPEFFDYVDATNPEHLNFTQLKGKQAIFRQLKFYKKYFRGYENAYIAEFASMVGIRESRNVVCEYVLTGEDCLTRKKFDDKFVQSNYPVDIHGRKLHFDHEIKPVDDKPYYEIPYRSLVVKGFDNLLVAGRCLGAEFLAQSSMRIMPTMRASGEAAGIAAAMAINKNIALREVDGVKVRERMIELGADYVV